MNKKIIIGLLACDNFTDHKYGPAIKAAKDTCYQSDNIPSNMSVYFLYGHREGVKINKNEYKVIGNKFYCDHEECKTNFIMKTLEFYEWCLDNVDFDYIYRGGANSYLDLNLFNKSFEESVFSLADNGTIYQTNYDIPSQKAWYGHGWFRWGKKWYPSGIGLLSRDMVELVVKNKHRVMSTFFHKCKIDDVAMGIFLRDEQGIKPKPLQPMLYIKYDENQKNKLSLYRTDISRDYIKHCPYFYFNQKNDPRAFHAVHKTRKLTTSDFKTFM